MKKIFLFIIATILIINSYSQEITYNNETSKIELKEILTFDSLNSNVIYLMIQDWFISNYPDKNTIQYSTLESGVVIGKASQIIHSTVLGYYNIKVSYKISVYFKNSKIKIEITDIIFQSPEGNYYTYTAEERIKNDIINVGSSKNIKLNNELKTETEKLFKNIVSSLKNKINIPTNIEW